MGEPEGASPGGHSTLVIERSRADDRKKYADTQETDGRGGVGDRDTSRRLPIRTGVSPCGVYAGSSSSSVKGEEKSENFDEWGSSSYLSSSL